MERDLALARDPGSAREEVFAEQRGQAPSPEGRMAGSPWDLPSSPPLCAPEGSSCSPTPRLWDLPGVHSMAQKRTGHRPDSTG